MALTSAFKLVVFFYTNDILRRECLVYHQLLLNVAGIDPCKYTTVASLCMAIHRNECLQPNTIAEKN
jgi:hypothetical protein